MLTRSSARPVLVATLLVGISTVDPAPAHACGGCLAPAETVTTVDSHRMVIALSPDKTVLWDQIQYSGDPEDFVWVLPVPSPETTIEIADGAFFDQLDGQTAPQVRPQPTSTGGTGVGCGGAAAYDAEGGGGGVTIFDTKVVGPYETVTIGSDDPDALYVWLTEHGYAISAETADVMDEYIDQESVFVVMRLAPEAGVDAMQPVRVSYPGYMGQFPLKMVKIGAQGTLKLALWVIADQRYKALNYGNTTVSEQELTYDWNSNSSDYDDVFLDTIDRAGGRAWVTEYAGPAPWIQSDEWDRVLQVVATPYVTRLRTDLWVDYLTDDLKLGVSNDPQPVDNFLRAGTELNRPAGQSDDGCSATTTGAVPLATLATFFSLLLMARRRRRI